MQLWWTFWSDESGAILSAELVMVGTLAVIGVTVGLATLSEAVNEELLEVAGAIRSLDQSYCVESRAGCRAWTAGSCYRQQDVEESLAELQCDIHDHENQFQSCHHDRRRPHNGDRDDLRRERLDERRDERPHTHRDRDMRRQRDAGDRDHRRRERYDDDRDDRRRESRPEFRIPRRDTDR